MKLFCLDTETTGFYRKVKETPLNQQPEIFDFCGILIDTKDNCTEIERFEFKCRTRKPIPPKIEELLGVKNEDFNGLPYFEHFHPELKEIFAKSDGWCAHNLKFDSTMLLIEMLRLRKHKEFPWPKVGICTMKLSRSLYPRGKHTLRDLHYRLCDKTTIQTHTALDDTLDLVDIVREFQRDGDFPTESNIKIFE